jgi:imidazoleglycerol-phosphate dehydratase / histidinol-phosphatase
MVSEYLAAHEIDVATSAVIGDRATDLEFARNLGIRGVRVNADAAEGATWPRVVEELLARRAVGERRTKETHIQLAVDLDSEGPIRIDSGHGFFDHMLEQLARHGGFALDLQCKGDLHIDEHHTVEDCALALGETLRRALGNKLGIQRYGFLLPMDESRVQVAIDLSGRAYSVFEGHFNRPDVGGLPTELVPHFFRSLADTLGAAIHISVTGENTHHMVEGCFKGVGRALRQAFRREGSELPSTKGVL